MQIGKTLYVKTRKAWRAWLSNNHNKEKEIWLIYYKKASGKPRITYDDAVEEALCYGWIDSTVKGIDDETYAQRFSIRRAKSNWSVLNIERMKKLIRENLMTPAGLKYYTPIKEQGISPDILKELKKDELVWTNFQNFPKSYQNIRLGFIEAARSRPDDFIKRLNNFIEKTKKNKKIGWAGKNLR